VHRIAAVLTGARPRRAASLSLIAIPLAVLAGCGSSSKSSTTTTTETTPASTGAGGTAAPSSTSPAASGAAGAATTLSLEANKEGQLRYDKTSLNAKAGTVTINFTNMAELSHNVTVESSSGTNEGATPTFSGSSKTLTLTLKAGTYKFFCSVPGHRMAGMEGTLKVQ
jgi:plastocyanin